MTVFNPVKLLYILELRTVIRVSIVESVFASTGVHFNYYSRLLTAYCIIVCEMKCLCKIGYISSFPTHNIN